MLILTLNLTSILDTTGLKFQKRYHIPKRACIRGVRVKRQSNITHDAVR